MADGFSNAYRTTLNGAIDNSQTTLVVTSDTGAPATTPFRLRLSAEGSNTNEIVTVTGVSGTTYTVTRASEAYNGVQAASAHASGAVVQHVLTAGGLISLTSTAFLGYNTIGGSTQAMTAQRVYCKQITAGAIGNNLLGIQAYMDQNAEAFAALGFLLFADSGSDTIGDLLLMTLTPNIVFAHGTGGGISFPPRWYGMPVGYPLTASTKYWIGVVLHSGGSVRLYYDGSGSDRYFAAGVTPYYPDGAYNTGAQTNTTNKHSIRALVL